jgi:anti-sigma B factor antagonist
LPRIEFANNQLEWLSTAGRGAGEANMLALSERLEGNIVVVSLSGRVDSTNSEELTNKLRGYNGADLRAVILNLSSLNYITSAGFRSLVLAKNDAQARKRNFILAGVHGNLRELLSLTGLFTFFEVYETESSALSRLN